MITEDIRLPFTTIVLGLTFGVRKIDLNDAAGLGETCEGGRPYATLSTGVFAEPVARFALHG
ncbi:MAG: hypothetical protein ABSG85_08095 [Spirochaetia bacterium]